MQITETVLKESIQTLPDAEAHPFSFLSHTITTNSSHVFDALSNQSIVVKKITKMKFSKDQSGLFWMFRGYMESNIYQYR